jgi:hypothetical protein
VNTLAIPPKPAKVYSGIFNVAPTNVDAPLLPVVVRVIAFCFELNVNQSALVKYPFTLLVAAGMLIVLVPLFQTRGVVASISAEVK